MSLEMFYGPSSRLPQSRNHRRKCTKHKADDVKTSTILIKLASLSGRTESAMFLFSGGRGSWLTESDLPE